MKFQTMFATALVWNNITLLDYCVGRYAMIILSTYLESVGMNWNDDANLCYEVCMTSPGCPWSCLLRSLGWLVQVPLEQTQVITIALSVNPNFHHMSKISTTCWLKTSCCYLLHNAFVKRNAFCRYPEDRVPPCTSSKSRRKIRRVHMPTCPVALAPASPLRGAPKLPRCPGSRLLARGSSGTATCPVGSSSRVLAQSSSEAATCPVGGLYGLCPRVLTLKFHNS
jgi:hypothetical protein